MKTSSEGPVLRTGGSRSAQGDTAGSPGPHPRVIRHSLPLRPMLAMVIASVRRAVVVLTALLALAAAAATASSSPTAASTPKTYLTSASATATTALPSVNMEVVVIASQVEPRMGNKPKIGDAASTKLVQKALRAKGYSITVDGCFGSGTAAIYAKWQRRLGYSGLGANGIPGPTSLTKLGGDDRFTVTRKIIVGARTTYSGKTVNSRTKAMLTRAHSMVSWPLELSQGSYHPGNEDSAHTHDGGGVIDIRVASMNTTQRWKTVHALRTVGFATWLRSPSQGNWPWHIHAVGIGDTDMSIAARNQVADYYVGKNGLGSHAADNTPRAYRVAFTWWEKYRR